ncbi:MAG: hypothetical protein HC817_13010 [Saprospiraceae bacterium]|nr:hypothetical protein [Saprospiraceae bacterium]
MHTEIETPEPNRSIVLIEAAVIFLSVFFVFHTLKNDFSAIFVAGLLASVYFIWRMIEADDLKAQMRKMPSRILYSYLPNFQYPANEHWLVVGEEIFEKHPHIQPNALNTLCAQQGLGLFGRGSR